METTDLSSPYIGYDDEALIIQSLACQINGHLEQQAVQRNGEA
jgi:hypothetical protein